MRHILPFLIALLICAGPGTAAIPVSKLNVEYVRTFAARVAVLAATDKLLFVSDASWGNGGKSGESRLLVCDRATGEIVHEFKGPFSRRPHVSGFASPLTSAPVLLDDGFVYLDADWHLRRIKLPPAGAQAVEIWNFDIPESTHFTPRLNDDIGYLLPAVTLCGDALLLTFNSAPAGATAPIHTTMIAVNAADGKPRWVRNLGPAGPCDRSPTCVPVCVPEGADSFRVITASGDVQTFSLKGDLMHAFRPSGEYRPVGKGSPWRGESGNTWELSRVGKNRLLAFAGHHVESGAEEPLPVSCIETGGATDVKVLWRTMLPVGSVAAPVAGRNLYFRSARILTALDPNSGKKLWSHEEKDDGCGFGFLPPVVHAGVVYFMCEDGLRLFHDADERAEICTVEFPNLLSTHTPPIIHGDTLYVTEMEKLYAIKLPIIP